MYVVYVEKSCELCLCVVYEIVVICCYVLCDCHGREGIGVRSLPRPGGLEMMCTLMLSLGCWRAGCEFPVSICGGGKPRCVCVEV